MFVINSELEKIKLKKLTIFYNYLLDVISQLFANILNYVSFILIYATKSVVGNLLSTLASFNWKY